MAKRTVAVDLPFDKYNAIDMSVAEFDAAIGELLNSIDATRETGRIFVEFDFGYYDEGASLYAYLYRYETDEEEEAREAREREALECRRAAEERICLARERQLYEQLKAKFELEQPHE